MIAHIEKGSGFSNCIDYCEEKDGAEKIGGNMSGQTKAEIVSEFNAICDMNQRCKNPVFHASLSGAPGEYFTDEQWNDIAKDYLKGMGFEDNQHVIYRHKDTDHDHIHIVANRIKTNDLLTVNDSFERRKSQVISRQIEEKYSMKKVEKMEEKSDKGYAAQVRKKIDLAIYETAGDAKKFAKCCEKNGLIVKLNQQSTGRIAGASFGLKGGKIIKGSELGQQYKYSRIENRIAKINEIEKISSSKSKSISVSSAAQKKQSKNPAGVLTRDQLMAIEFSKRMAEKLANSLCRAPAPAPKSANKSFEME